VPNQLVNMNNGLSTLQFQSLSVSAQRPQNLLQGGTQDNGRSSPTVRIVWPQIIYGDGGQSGFNVADDALRFNTFTGQANDANFRDGDPTKWVIISAPILSSPEGAFFYPPIVADPHPAGRAPSSRDRSRSGARRTGAATATTSKPTAPSSRPPRRSPAAGLRPIGTPLDDLTAAVWGNRPAARWPGSARRAQNTGTMWAATSTGRVFITDNADAAAASVVWNRVDPRPRLNDPPCHQRDHDRSANPHHAWISYNGYNVNTPPRRDTSSKSPGAERVRRVGGSQLQPAGLPDHRAGGRRSDRRSVRVV
jgi:hypothetical protein